MRSSRFLATLAASVLLVVYTGCGGEEKKEPGSTSSGGPARPRTSDKPSATTGATAGDTATGQTSAANTSGSPFASAGKGAIDFSLAMPEHFAAIIINPRRIAASPLVAEQLKTKNVAEAIKNFGIDPTEVEQIVLLLGSGNLQQPGKPDRVVFMTTRFTHDVDAKDILTKLYAAGSKGPQPINEIQVAGKTCLDDGKENGALTYAPSKNTIIMASKGPKSATEHMEKILAASEPKGPLHERLKKANPDNDLVVVAEMENFPDLDKIIDGAKASAPQMGNYLDGVKSLRGVTLGLNLTGDSLLQMILETKDAAGVEPVEGLLKDGVKMLDGGLAAIKQSVSKDARAQLADAFKLGEDAVAGITVTKNGNEVTVTMKRPAGMDKAGSLVEKAIPAIMMGSGGGQPRPMTKQPMPMPPPAEKK